MNTIDSVQRLTEELARLPGIGPKSAERISHHLLQISAENANALADAIRDVKAKVRHCAVCSNLTETEICPICRDERRDRSLLCVVEQPRDLASLEKTGSFDGVYHVLLGRIAPLEGMTPDKLTIRQLVGRVREGGVKEIVMATNPTLEGDGTALYLSNLLADYPVRVTRLARGLASGTVLEFANKEMLADALSGRREL